MQTKCRLKVTAEIPGEFNSFNFETCVKQPRLYHVHKLFYELCLTYLKNFVALKGVHQYCTRQSCEFVTFPLVSKVRCGT